MREGWKKRKLGEVCETTSGGTPSKSKVEYYENGNIPWLRSGEVDRKYIDTTELFITELGLKNSSAKWFPVNTVVIAMYGATVGQVGILKKEMTTNQAICGIFPNDLLCPAFLYYFFITQRDNYLRIATGGAQPNISQTIIKNTYIPFPSLSEQQHIVSELDCLNGIIEKKKEQLKQLDELAQSIFYDMFGDPVENEKGWEVSTLGSFSNFKNGINFKKAENGNLVYFLSVSDFADKKKIEDLSDFSTVLVDSSIDENYYLQDEDIVFVRSNGSKKLVGRSIIVYPGENKVTYSGFCIRCRITRNSVDFIGFLLSCSSVRKVIDHLGRGANISNLNQQLLSSIQVIEPPLELQQQFAQKITAIEQQKKLIKQSLTETETLFNSRMDYYFG